MDREIDYFISLSTLHDADGKLERGPFYFRGIPDGTQHFTRDRTKALRFRSRPGAEKVAKALDLDPAESNVVIWGFEAEGAPVVSPKASQREIDEAAAKLFQERVEADPGVDRDELLARCFAEVKGVNT